MRRLVAVSVFVGALGIWEGWARASNAFLFPTATEVAERAWQVWPTADFLMTVSASLQRLAAGYAVGVGTGVVVGLLLGSSRAVRRTFEPLVEFLRATPAVTIMPAAIVILGLGDGMRVAVIAFGVCFPVLVNTVEGVAAVSPEARDTATMLHVGPAGRILRIYLPAALPSIVAGLRVALSIGLALLVISEFVGGEDGLGHYIILQQSQFNVPEMYAGILFLGLLGYMLNRLFLVAERHVLFWHYGAVGDSPR
jgi:ABC-type nitrate/sulfonate/bicarbonate transport system permease component